FLRIAYGSSAELETQLTLARELEFISQQDFDTLMDSLTGVRMMLNKLMSSIAKS
ncbi:four helix bundle protein, partial [Candidatus Nomurabacteria bacterium]|nr:four helix bundle protein [Candidatus Nomurabacteria bacterium]